MQRIPTHGILTDEEQPLLWAIVIRGMATQSNPLTPRERDVLSASLFGASLSEIAAQLHLSDGTVSNHLSTAMHKLGAQNRKEAARLAEQKGWL